MKTSRKTVGVGSAAALVAVAGLMAGSGCSNNSRSVFSTVPPDKAPLATGGSIATSPATNPSDTIVGKPLNRQNGAIAAAPGAYPDPLELDRMTKNALSEWEAQGTQAPVFAAAPAARRQAEPAVNMYGETPGNPAMTNEALLLDGMESLSQVTFAAEGGAFDPCVSRDGKMIVFTSTQHRPTADIYIKPVNGRTLTQLTADPAHDIMPVISPDGQRIAFASNRAGSWDIYVMSVNGGQAVQVTSDKTHELHPSWSPDGTRLVFCRLGEVSGRWEMWVSDVNQTASSEFIGYGLFPSWSPVAAGGEGGRDKILFQRSRERGDRAFSVWTLDYKPGDTSSPTEIASSQSAALINPAWSPDGQRIVFGVVPNPGAATGGATRPQMADLWMADITGGGRVNLTAGRFVNLMPTWSPDGRIYFVSDRGGVDNIWSIGTEKAVFAATGTGRARHTETATAPEHTPAAEH
ncbi:MAG: PD40 domain-containing protein [Phycisphaeraceae bacterium]|nr:PD40 domain-containing protein [Phycisphaeraceae bacterium]